MLNLLHPASWQDYQLIDSGEGEKLERFGQYTLIRPEPQAIWKKVLSDAEWTKLATARFDREQKDKFRFSDDVKGGWQKSKDMPESWQVSYPLKDRSITLRLALTSFGHVGIFPEQGENWNFIYNTVKSWSVAKPRVLNLFAYTGAASIVAKAAGADVTHVDASRPGINWANQNMQLNDLADIRWVYEDAFKFVKREVKRGNKYNGKNAFFILSTYAVGLSSLVSVNVVKSHFNVEPEFGEFFLKSKSNRDLPMGTFLRFNV